MVQSVAGLKRRVLTPPYVIQKARSVEGLELVWSGSVRDEDSLELTVTLFYKGCEGATLPLAHFKNIPYYRLVKPVEHHIENDRIKVTLVVASKKAAG